MTTQQLLMNTISEDGHVLSHTFPVVNTCVCESTACKCATATSVLCQYRAAMVLSNGNQLAARLSGFGEDKSQRMVHVHNIKGELLMQSLLTEDAEIARFTRSNTLLVVTLTSVMETVVEPDKEPRPWITRVTELPDNTTPVAVDSDGSFLWVGGSDGRLLVFHNGSKPYVHSLVNSTILGIVVAQPATEAMVLVRTVIASIVHIKMFHVKLNLFDRCMRIVDTLEDIINDTNVSSVYNGTGCIAVSFASGKLLVAGVHPVTKKRSCMVGMIRRVEPFDPKSQMRLALAPSDIYGVHVSSNGYNVMFCAQNGICGLLHIAWDGSSSNIESVEVETIVSPVILDPLPKRVCSMGLIDAPFERVNKKVVMVSVHMVNMILSVYDRRAAVLAAMHRATVPEETGSTFTQGEIFRLSRENRKLNASVDEFTEKLFEAEEKIEVLEKALAGLEHDSVQKQQEDTSHTELEQRLAESKTANATLVQRLIELGKDAMTAKERAAEMEKKWNKAKEHATRLQKEKTKKETETARLVKNMEEQHAKNVEDKVQAVRKKLETRRTKSENEFRTKLTEWEQKYAAAQATADRAHRKMEAAQAELSKLRNTCTETSAQATELATLRDHCAMQAKDLEGARKELEDARALSTALGNDLEALKTRHASDSVKAADFKKIKNECLRLERAYAKLKEDHAKLKAKWQKVRANTIEDEDVARVDGGTETKPTEETVCADGVDEAKLRVLTTRLEADSAIRAALEAQLSTTEGALEKSRAEVVDLTKKLEQLVKTRDTDLCEIETAYSVKIKELQDAVKTDDTEALQTLRSELQTHVQEIGKQRLQLADCTSTIKKLQQKVSYLEQCIYEANTQLAQFAMMQYSGCDMYGTPLITTMQEIWEVGELRKMLASEPELFERFEVLRRAPWTPTKDSNKKPLLPS